MKKVAVGLSGGVDSAVAALVLKRQGYEVAGVHLYCWPPPLAKQGKDEWADMRGSGCRADEDRKSALKTALELKIPFKVLDFSKEYKERVVDYFYLEYKRGRTPNPDVLCNSEVKFGLFLDWALGNGFDYVATGHYAKLLRADKKIRLGVPKDEHKDQTYFLWKLRQKELGRVLFPLGDYWKSEVREIARENKLSAAERADSQGICFVGEVEVKDFLRRRLGEKRGKVLDTKGRAIGVHQGVWFCTIGQRGGWELTARAQKKLAVEGKTPIFYVVSKEAKRNEVVVGFGAETYKSQFEAAELNWLNDKLNFKNILVRIRHGGSLIKCRVEERGKCLRVELVEPQRGIAPGQSAVFYSKEGECWGGGVIE